MTKIVLFNKPYGVISQFRAHEKYPTLSNYIKNKQLRIAGRLDTDSEGLMVLTDNGKLNAALTQPKNKRYKTYLTQVEGLASNEQISALSRGITLKDGPTLEAKVNLISPPALWPRNPPVRFRKNVPTSWLKIAICEGKNRQVRRMTAAVDLPTLRLVRIQVSMFELDRLSPGQSITITPGKAKLRKLLNQ